LSIFSPESTQGHFLFVYPLQLTLMPLSW